MNEFIEQKEFELVSVYTLNGGQLEVIDKLVKGLEKNQNSRCHRYRKNLHDSQCNCPCKQGIENNEYQKINLR